MRETASIELWRAAAEAPPASAASARPARTDLPDGRKRKPPGRFSLTARGAGAATARPREALVRAVTRSGSPPGGRLLRSAPKRRGAEAAEELDLVPKLDAVFLVRAAAGLDHQRDRVRAACPVGVLDEVRVLRRDLRAADAVTLQAAGLEHPPRAQLVVRILEDAAERALVRRLRCLAPRVEIRDLRLDLLRRARIEPQLRLDDDLPVPEARVTVGQPELRRGEPAGAVRRCDEGADEDLRELAAVCPCVHPDAAAGRAGNRAGELEAAEPRAARLVQTDGVGRAATGSKQVALGVDLCERSAELQDERVRSLVGDQQVRPETDRCHLEVALGRPAEGLLHLADRLGTRECLRRAPRAESGEARELDPLLDVHASAPRMSDAARSTSPAPSVSTVSPLRAQDATMRAPSSTEGMNASRMPGRTCASSSTIRRPLTPGSGSSRAV